MKRKLDILEIAGRCPPGATASPTEITRGLADRFKALGDPTRLAIHQLAGADEVCVCELVPDAGLSQRPSAAARGATTGSYPRQSPSSPAHSRR